VPENEKRNYEKHGNNFSQETAGRIVFFQDQLSDKFWSQGKTNSGVQLLQKNDPDKNRHNCSNQKPTKRIFILP
jgi:hypothetical protein